MAIIQSYCTSLINALFIVIFVALISHVRTIHPLHQGAWSEGKGGFLTLSLYIRYKVLLHVRNHWLREIEVVLQSWLKANDCS